MNLPICKDCHHFLSDSRGDALFGKCKKFESVVSEEEKYQSADLSRTLDKFCGEEGKYYFPKTNAVNCENCKYFLPDTGLNTGDTRYGKCSKFGEKNLVTGEFYNKYAFTCRSFDMYCGEQGKYFEEKPIAKKARKPSSKKQ